MTARQSFLESESIKLVKEKDDYLGRANDSVIEATDGVLERANDDRLIHAGDSRPIKANDEDGGTTRRCLNTPTLLDGRTHTPPPREKAWAVAFKVNVALTIISAVWALSRRARAAEDSGERLVGRLDEPLANSCFLVPLVAITYAILPCMLRIMSGCSRLILQIASVVFVVASGVLVIWMFSAGYAPCATFAAAVCAGVGHVFFRRGRIAFAAENLKVAALIVRCMPKVFMWSLCVAATRLLLLVTAGIALAGSIADIPRVRGSDGTMYRADDCQTISWSASCRCNGDIVSEGDECQYIHGVKATLLVCFWMATMGWGFVVCTNIMTATVARSVALWWSSPEDVESVWRSCQHVIKSSLGTLCKGSAIDGPIELLNEGVQRLPPLFAGVVCQSLPFMPEGGDVPGILDIGADWRPWGSLVYLVQPLGVVFGLPLMLVKLVSGYVMGYTAVFVGMHGVGVSEGLGRTKELFREVGTTLITNDLVVGVGLLVTVLAPFGLYAYVGFHESSGWGSLASAVLFAFVVLINAAIVIVLLPMIEVVLCAYRAVFVCFLKDPEAFSANHDRQLLVGLRRAWQTMKLSHSARTDGGHGVVQV